jgi:4-hydroxy-tetrahydrodipicolinate reductase
MRIAIIGYGKMGKAIESAAIQRGHEVVLKISTSNLNDLSPQQLSKADVAIEFSTPETAVANIHSCFTAGVPVVVGTTGWYQHFDSIREQCLAGNHAMLYASNFSIGVNIVFEINRMLARMMNHQPRYDVSISETHHIHKKDAPSGTAITLAQGICSELKRKSDWILNQGQQIEHNSIAIKALREDDVPGTHDVLYHSDEDEILIRHTAFGREGFATGAVAAAEWLAGKPGCHSIRDMLHL